MLGGQPANVDTVLVGGEVRKRGGRLVRGDRDRVRGLANASCAFIQRLLEADASLGKVVDWDQVYEK